MKLSEAILKGIEHYPEKAYNAYFSETNQQAACALGCAIYALYGKSESIYEVQLLEDYPELEAEFNGQRLIAIISDWNDSQGKSREKIADDLNKLGF